MGRYAGERADAIVPPFRTPDSFCVLWPGHSMAGKASGADPWQDRPRGMRSIKATLLAAPQKHEAGAQADECQAGRFRDNRHVTDFKIIGDIVKPTGGVVV